MAVKDLNTGENTDRKRPLHEAAAPVPDAVEENESSQIKNAHATGDGSFGRNDESLPDEGESEGRDTVEKDGSNY